MTIARRRAGIGSRGFEGAALSARPLVLLALAGCAHHIPAPVGDVPAMAVAPAPSTLTVCPVEFATGKLPGGLVVARGKVRGALDSTASGILLRHPSGATWLVDGGMAAAYMANIGEVKGFVGFAMRQSAKDWARVASPADAVRAAGADPAALTGLIPTHGHYDHLGGLLDLPDVPVWAPEAEIALARAAVAGEDAPILPAEARAFVPRAKAILFDGPAVGPWSSSWDLFGDGSAMVVPMPGHTPGSLGVYVHLADGRRAFLVGDTVWVREGYEAREPKSWIAGAFDADAGQNDLQIQRLWQLRQADPELIIVPAHDARQWKVAFPAGCVTP